MPSALRRQIGQLLIAGFNGHQIPPELRSLAREFGLGGVILFARNIAEPEQVAEVAFDAARLVPDLPAWVSVDQEGGRVARLKAPFTEWPPMATLGRSGDADAGRAIRARAGGGAEEPSASRSTTRRCSTSTPTRRTRSSAIARWRRRPKTSRGSAPRSCGRCRPKGIAACGKHFPGHGDTSTDSHFELPLVEHPPDRLRAVEFVPFKAAIDAGVATIMTAHVLVPSLDEQRPATLSRRIVYDLLRDELKFEGVILSDDLEMKAIAAEYAVPEAAVLAIEAGCDGMLICSGDHDTQAAALEALVHAVEDRAAAARPRRGRAEAPAAREGAISRRRRSRPRPARRTRAARGARPRRASRDRRRDGALPVMRKPRALAPGDRLAIVAPASPFTREEFDRGIEEIRRLGFEPVYDDSVFARQRYVAGSPAVRAAAIHDGVARSVDCRPHRRPRRLRQRAGAAAARSRPRRSAPASRSSATAI